MKTLLKVLLLYIFCFCKVGLGAQKKIDTTHILKLIKEANAICENETKKTIAMGQQALVYSKKINYKKGEISAYNIIGVGYDISSQYDSALYFYNLGLSNFKKISDLSLKASLYNNIGLSYWNLSNYKEAIIRYHKALSIFKQLEDVNGLAKTYNNLGLLYDDLQDAKTAIINYKNAIVNYTKLKDSCGLSIVYLNLGSTYLTYGDAAEAESYFNKSIQLKPANDYYGRSILLLNWAQLKNQINQVDTAIIMLRQSIVLKEKIQDVNGLITAYNVLSLSYHKTNKYVNSLEAAKKALHLNQNIQSKRRLIKTYALLKRSYMYLNMTDSAIKYNDLEYELKDSIFSENLTDAIAEENVKYKTLSVENENLSLKLKNDKQHFTLKNIYISLGFIVIFTVLLLIYINRIKKNKLIIEQQEQTNQLNHAVIETEQIERIRIARDLHDSVGQKLSVLKMQLSMKDINPIASINLLDEAIQDIRNVSHNLIPTDLSKGLLIALKNMQEQINFSSTMLKVKLQISNSAYALQIEQQQILLIYRIIQELINNVIKHAQANNITIDVDALNKKLKLTISDDGVGFDTTILEQEMGIGIKNINERIKKLIGSMQLTSSIGKGTIFNITIPV